MEMRAIMELKGIKAFSHLDQTQEAVREAETTLENLNLRYNVRRYKLLLYRCADDPVGLSTSGVTHQAASAAGAGERHCGFHSQTTWYAYHHSEYFGRHCRESQAY